MQTIQKLFIIHNSFHSTHTENYALQSHSYCYKRWTAASHILSFKRRTESFTKANFKEPKWSPEK